MSEDNAEVVTEEVHEEKPRPKDLPQDQEWERVDFKTADPEVIERRFNRVYGSMKMTESALKKAAEDNRKLMERLEAIETETRESKISTERETLKAEKAKALEEGDSMRVVELDERLAELRTPKPEPKKEAPPPQNEWFTPEKRQKLASWAAETDADGNLKRPWAQEGHPKNARAVEIINGVLNDPDFVELDDILAEADRLMAPRQKPAAAVLSGGSPPPRREASPTKLSEEEKLVARRMYSDMDPAEAIKKYADAKKRIS